MRFVRVFLDRDTGAPVGVVESELPIDARYRDPQGELPFTDLGLVMDFDGTDLEGRPTTVSDAIRQRLEKHPDADSNPDAPRVRFKAGVTGVPDPYYIPCGEKQIKDFLRSQGASRLHPFTRAWLVRISPPDVLSALGVDLSVPLSVLKSLEVNRRGTIDGGLVANFERAIQKQSDVRSAAALAARLRDAAPPEQPTPGAP